VTIACFGLAFKPDIDDLRESPALYIAERIEESHPGQILVVEPNVEKLPEGKLQRCVLVEQDVAFDKAHVIALLVDHKQFKDTSARAVESQYLVDSRGIWVARSAVRAT
jgi:UDP-N-acetyl-D-mannosaminuronic acid dehydrogenase